MNLILILKLISALTVDMEYNSIFWTQGIITITYVFIHKMYYNVIYSKSKQGDKKAGFVVGFVCLLCFTFSPDKILRLDMASFSRKL